LPVSNRVTRAVVALTLLLCLVGPLSSSAEATGTGSFSAHPTTPSCGDVDAVVANYSAQAETVCI
jgi:hypothetical protein